MAQRLQLIIKKLSFMSTLTVQSFYFLLQYFQCIMTTNLLCISVDYPKLVRFSPLPCMSFDHGR